MSVQERYELDGREVYKLTPGIVEEVEKYDGETIIADYLDLEYDNTKVGTALKVIAQHEALEPVRIQKKRADRYTKTGESFEQVYQESEQLLRERIDRIYNLKGMDSQSILEDLEEKGLEIWESFSGSRELIQFRTGDYHADTLRFFDKLGVIKEPDDREIIAPQTDIDFIEQNFEQIIGN